MSSDVPPFEMKTEAQVEQDFRNDLKALLDKYRAEIEASDHWTGYAECGSDIRMVVSIPALFDGEHNCTREAAEVDLGRYLVSDRYRDSSDQESDLFYLQESSSYVGNNLLFWAKDGRGYTTDLRRAHVYTREQVVTHHRSRETDIPWPKAYIDAHANASVDMQYVRRDEALSAAGIVLNVPNKRKVRARDQYRCGDCGSFMNGIQHYSSGCPKCGANHGG